MSSVESDVLVHLMREHRSVGRKRTVPVIAATIRHSESAVSGYLKGRRDLGWVTSARSKEKWMQGTVWTLTEKGREVARYRSRNLRYG